MDCSNFCMDLAVYFYIQFSFLVIGQIKGRQSDGTKTQKCNPITSQQLLPLTKMREKKRRNVFSPLVDCYVGAMRKDRK